ncbi:ABC transporter [Anaerosporomusa subterranea]|uniref:ABC transporter n=1 Tax=Anaerosporomusa subterranea TaxID=1794912 RepID=A0A154BUR3_ANASB|nr:ABC transporter ATP-binding protein [Anaerosporomusa subterranea]KYZ77763.1 ABC transporter [Anaerosporomusa subterranea]
MFLDLKDISFKYDGTGQYVLKDFNLQAAKGEIVSIIGLSGSGKSTVIRLIAGLEVPNAGTITVNNRIVADKTTFVPPEKRRIGMVFQDYALFPHLTVYSNIAFGLSEMPKRERQVRIDRLLALINMSEYKDRYPYQLSGGQQQRVAVARALAPNPDLLLMDEPFSNIDCELKQKMRMEIRTILKAESVTCIFVTHDKSDVEDLSERTITIVPALMPSVC